MTKTNPAHSPAGEEPAAEPELTPEQLAELGYDESYAPPTRKQLFLLIGAGAAYVLWLAFMLVMARHS